MHTHKEHPAIRQLTVGCSKDLRALWYLKHLLHLQTLSGTYRWTKMTKYDPCMTGYQTNGQRTTVSQVAGNGNRSCELHFLGKQTAKYCYCCIFVSFFGKHFLPHS